MSAWPQFDRWFDEQRELIRQVGTEYPALPLALEVEDPGPPSTGSGRNTGEKNNQVISPQEAQSMFEQIQELAGENPQPTPEKPEGPRCEYCGAHLKEAKQARAIHLRYCQAYKATKANGHAASPLAAEMDGQDVLLTPERTSKLWQAITGGTLQVAVEDGRVVCRVSKSSFDKALPVLLDLL